MVKPSNIKSESIVNAYLFYSQRLLNLLTTAELIEHKADDMAITASVCLSLKQVWQAWLIELEKYVGHPIQDYNSIFLSENSHFPEIECLLDLSRQPNNWLTQLMELMTPRLNIASTPALQNEHDALAGGLPSKRISLVSVEGEVGQSDKTLSDKELLTKVLTEFKDYIQAVRGRQAEW